MLELLRCKRKQKKKVKALHVQNKNAGWDKHTADTTIDRAIIRKRGRERRNDRDQSIYWKKTTLEMCFTSY